VDNLQADINLNAQVANLVSLNAGVAVSVQKINLTIVDVEAELEYAFIFNISQPRNMPAFLLGICRCF
jgi:hypothetical protein